MIRVKRGEAPKAVYKAGGIAEKERDRNKRLPAKKKKFKVYKDARIKAELERLFHGKCAYCEALYVLTHPVDIEHWRPKSKFPLDAAEWENLFPSCIDCNRMRKHEVDVGGGVKKTLLLGKGDRFPVDASKKPLLLHPCDDEPKDHIVFDDQGVVKAQGRTAKAAASIEHYALNRMALVHARYERRLLAERYITVIRTLAAQLERIDDLAARATGAQATRLRQVSQAIDELIWSELAALKALVEDKQPFAQVVRQVVDSFLGSKDGVPRW